ncbi:MAG: aldo/keto reductase [Lachnospiraceae bacterium]|nr:aldo/keto reductase [Solobacterium sp.]MBR2995248.1 aldo/keto reductase [Lachnospiraceae bacterium]
MTDIKRLGLGCMGKNMANKERSIETVRYILDHGVTMLNTGEFYGGGESEMVLSECRGNKIRVRGIVSFASIDIHGLPAVQLSDTADGKNMVFCVFNEAGILDQVKAGDSVTMEGNYLVYNDEFGIVLKNCSYCRPDKNEK